jgi:hypothetical protein
MTEDAGNPGMIVQQTIQQSYARQTGALPPAAGAQQQQQGPNTRVKWGQPASDEAFEEVRINRLLIGHIMYFLKSPKKSQIFTTNYYVLRRTLKIVRKQMSEGLSVHPV